jgi:hypothetical protein
MSISSISAPAPVAPPAVNPPVVSAPQTPDDSDTAQATRATVPAPLPPGQGTRVDQIV